MLGLSFVIHETLVVLMTLYNKAEVIPTLEHTFNEWLPVLAGLGHVRKLGWPLLYQRARGTPKRILCVVGYSEPA
jgi:hypothetical protein